VTNSDGRSTVVLALGLLPAALSTPRADAAVALVLAGGTFRYHRQQN